MKENRKGFYQEIINEIIKQHGKDNFTYRLMGEKLEVSKQRAKQIVDYYQLDIPSYDYFASKECADLKKLIESNEVSQFTFQELYEKRYKRFLPHAFIMGLVSASGRTLLKKNNKALYEEFFSKTKTHDKTKRELFAEAQAMFPDKRFNYSSFCSDLDERKIPFKRLRKEFVGGKNLTSRLRRESISSLIDSFLTATAIDPSLYAMDQFYLLYEDYAKNNGKQSIEYLAFREVVVINKTPVAKTKPVALLNRLLSLGVDLKELSSKEIAELHNAKHPHFAIIPKMLNAYGLQSSLGRD